MPLSFKLTKLYIVGPCAVISAVDWVLAAKVVAADETTTLQVALAQVEQVGGGEVIL